MAEPAAGIRLQFATEAGFSSWVIRYFSHSAFSHVDAVLPDGRLLGARSDGGVQARLSNYATFSDRLIVDIPASRDQRRAFHRALTLQLGKPYDWRAIVAFAVDRNWRNPDSWYCSELQTYALIQAGILPNDLYLDANKITPGDLLFALSAIVRIPRPVLAASAATAVAKAKAPAQRPASSLGSI